MAHTWKHKKDEEAMSRYPKTHSKMKKNKKGELTLDLGELADQGYDVRGLFKGASFAEIERRLNRKKF